MTQKVDCALVDKDRVDAAISNIQNRLSEFESRDRQFTNASFSSCSSQIRLLSFLV